ncbi:MAG: restriction endonuclease [Chlorobi bacterium]|nr:restriction endonuclease [Chlorobiota bacterium]
MEIKENLQNLSDRVLDLKEKILTEEATKNAFVMPFIQLLGYDIFNPLEVVPEFVADVSNKKGEKVDYCIKKDNEPIIIIECKHWKENLDLHNTQLERYFSFTKAKFGILTNGIIYRFYTDIDETNKMDKNPFLEFDLENIRENAVTELSRFHKNSFDLEKIFDAAGEMKYYSAIKSVFKKELENPSDELVKFFARKIYSGSLTEKVVHQFQKIVKKALNHRINETINERLKSALTKEEEKQIDIVPKTDISNLHPHEIVLFEDAERGIVTTQEEINGFEIVLDILKDNFDKERIVYRDTKSYFGILLDDNNRQPICRFRFDTKQKYLSIIDEEKNENKYPIYRIEHIYKYSNEILKSALQYNEDD